MSWWSHGDTRQGLYLLTFGHLLTSSSSSSSSSLRTGGPRNTPTTAPRSPVPEGYLEHLVSTPPVPEGYLVLTPPLSSPCSSCSSGSPPPAPPPPFSSKPFLLCLRIILLFLLPLQRAYDLGSLFAPLNLSCSLCPYSVRKPSREQLDLLFQLRDLHLRNQAPKISACCTPKISTRSPQ